MPTASASRPAVPIIWYSTSEGEIVVPLVTVVIPMHNEEENAADTLAALAAALEAESWSYELVPVNDGSTDSTGQRLSELAEKDPRIRRSCNVSAGHGVGSSARWRGRPRREHCARCRGRTAACSDTIWVERARSLQPR